MLSVLDTESWVLSLSIIDNDYTFAGLYNGSVQIWKEDKRIFLESSNDKGPKLQATIPLLNSSNSNPDNIPDISRVNCISSHSNKLYAALATEKVAQTWEIIQVKFFIIYYLLKY